MSARVDSIVAGILGQKHADETLEMDTLCDAYAYVLQDGRDDFDFVGFCVMYWPTVRRLCALHREGADLGVADPIEPVRAPRPARAAL